MEVRRKNAGYVEGGRGGEADDGCTGMGGGRGRYRYVLEGSRGGTRSPPYSQEEGSCATLKGRR